ncbi:hypothetical protein D3C83_305450 [compost metagenome]
MIANDNGTAACGSTPITYTSTGSMMIDPPAPSSPSDTPTRAVRASPAISCGVIADSGA